MQLGAYHAGSDSVLVLDVARFKYPPHWVPIPTLFSAMCVVTISELSLTFLDFP